MEVRTSIAASTASMIRRRSTPCHYDSKYCSARGGCYYNTLSIDVRCSVHR